MRVVPDWFSFLLTLRESDHNFFREISPDIARELMLHQLIPNDIIGNQMKLGDVRKTRESRGWTQAQLAQAVGCGQSTISMVEKGKAEPSPVLWSRIKRALEASDQPYKSLESSIKVDLPEMPFEVFPRQLPIRVETWIRPEYAGDFIIVHVVGAEQALLVAMDVAGHGPSVIGKRIYVQGWLRGWLKNQTMGPRIQSLAEALSEEFKITNIQGGAYIAMLALNPTLPHTVSYEAAACGFPIPLLMAGLPVRTINSAILNSPLPFERGSIQTTRIEQLSAPWKIVIASDGLLSRLGGGNEFDGIKFLRKWQTGRDRDGVPERHLATEQPPIDDEFFALLAWNGWDRELDFQLQEQTEFERAAAYLDAKIRNAVGGVVADGFKQVLVEVVNNAWRHAYAGQNGRLRIRFREETDCLRIEIEDWGKGGITEKATSKGRSGFAVVKSNCGAVHVRNGRESGTVVELIIDKSPQSGGNNDRKE